MIFETSISRSSVSRAASKTMSRTVRSAIEHGVLHHHRHAHAFAVGDRAGIGRHGAAQDMQESGFAGAIGADDAEAVAIMQAERNLRENGARAEAFAQGIAGEKDGHILVAVQLHVHQVRFQVRRRQAYDGRPGFESRRQQRIDLPW